MSSPVVSNCFSVWSFWAGLAVLAAGRGIGYLLAMPMPRPARKSKKRPKIPSRQHPFLVGCTHQEAEFLTRAAAEGDEGPITFIRESAILRAARRLGERAPEGE